MFYLDEQFRYTLLQMTYFVDTPELQVGITAASPQGDGYEVVFEGYQVSRL